MNLTTNKMNEKNKKLLEDIAKKKHKRSVKKADIKKLERQANENVFESFVKTMESKDKDVLLVSLYKTLSRRVQDEITSEIINKNFNN